MLKAYSVYGAFVGEFDDAVIVFAQDEGTARALGYGSLRDCEFIDSRARRLPKIDKYATKTGVLCWHTDKRIYWEAGFHEENSEDSCGSCGRYEIDGVPESQLKNNQCRDCGWEEEGEDG